jgi:hypothetical protein
VQCLEAKAPPTSNFLLDSVNFGQLYELLCGTWAASSSPELWRSLPNGSFSRDDLASFLGSDKTAAREFLMYIHAKCSQERGLSGLAACSISAAWQSPLLRALAIPASVILSSIHQGASHHLVSHHFYPNQCVTTNSAPSTSPPSKQAPRAADAISNSAPSTSHPSRQAPAAADPSRSSSSSLVPTCPPSPPSWLHPLLHHLRPDQVVLLVSQLLLCLAGVPDSRWVAWQIATREVRLFGK